MLDDFDVRVDALASTFEDACLGQPYPIVVCALFTCALALLTEDLGHEPPIEIIAVVALMEHLRQTFADRALAKRTGGSAPTRES